MEYVLSEKLGQLSHKFHEFWLILEIINELMFLLNFQSIIFQDDFF